MLILIPLYNEADCVVDVIRNLRQVRTEDLLIVDDGSTDGSVIAIEASGVRLPHLIRHRRNRGYGMALRSGFEVALRQGYEIVVTFDAAGQHDPRDISRLLDVLPGADVVSGSRFHPDSPWMGTPPSERLRANQRLTASVRRHTGYEITDSACGLKAYRAAALRWLRITEPGYAMPYQVWGQAARLSLVVREVPVTMIYRDADDAGGVAVPPGSLDGIVHQCEMVLLEALGKGRARWVIRRWVFGLLVRIEEARGVFRNS